LEAAMSEVLDRIVRTREQAHQVSLIGYAHAQAILANGKPVRVMVQEHEEDRTLQANRYYWGPCLKEIAEQASLNGQRYVGEAWHEFFRRQYLGYEIRKTYVAGKKKPVIVRRLKSTRDLKVRAFSVYLEQIQAFASTDLGVRFSVRDWQEYQG
jgi:hypothetical protein